MNLAAAFLASADKHPAKTALCWGEQTYSYEALRVQTQRLASHLQESLMVKPGDRVGLWLKNCPEFVPALFGTLLAGGVVVPINAFLKPDELGYIMADAVIDVLITDSTMSEGLAKLSAARPQLRVCQVEPFTPHAAAVGQASRLPNAFLFPKRSESDLAVLIYTSGTTGHPKGAMLSHGNLLANVESCRQVLVAVEADRFAVLLPMFHSFMLCVGVFLPLLVGGSIVLVRSVHPAKNVLLEIIHHQATILPAVPQLFRSLANAPMPKDFPLRLCISGGAPLPREILREYNEKIPTIPLLEGYGLSEASPVVSMNPLAGPWKAGSIGLPIPGVEISVQNEGGNLLPQGQTGEICVRGANVMLGYWNQPEETAQVLRDGWLLTGDIGYQDSDGYSYITDRKKDMLLVNGINVYPREIEEILYRYPGVKEAAVIGVPDPRKGERPLAFVSPKDGTHLDEKSLLQFVREKLADYKVPRDVVFMAALPRNSTGKVLKTSLRQQAG